MKAMILSLVTVSVLGANIGWAQSAPTPTPVPSTSESDKRFEESLEKHRAQLRKLMLKQHGDLMDKQIDVIVSQLSNTKTGELTDATKRQILALYNSFSEEQQYVFREKLLSHMDNVSPTATWSKRVLIAGVVMMVLGVVADNDTIGSYGGAVTWVGFLSWATARLVTRDKYKEINRTVKNLRVQLEKDQAENLDLLTKKLMVQK